MKKSNVAVSAGVIPLAQKEGEWKVLLIQHHGYEAYWACPKGHVEPGEHPQEAARRELKEETGLDIQKWLDHEPLIEEFEYIRREEKVKKRVCYFVAVVEGDLLLQKGEIAGGEWFSLSEAIEKVIHPAGKVTLKQVQHLLRP